jgi:tetratricopeptide (TPR) repeat protein
LSINFFHHDTNNEKSAMEMNGEFLQTQLLIDCLGQMKATDTDKDKLADLCKKLYEENPCQQAKIEEFKNTYSPDQAIRWYTKDSFLYRTLNRALRAQNTDQLLLFHFFIRDIEKQLRDHQHPSPVTLYRGQVISKDELKLFENSNNKLISITSFFSTSLDSRVAVSYIDPDTTYDNLQSVLFEIHADPTQNQSKPFADITSISHMPDEQEVLMMLGSVFRIDSVDCLTDTIKHIRMTVCNYNDQNFNSLFNFMSKNECIGTTRLTDFGCVLIGMAKFDAAENHFKCLLRTFSPDHPDVFDCYQALGKIYCEKCDFDWSLQCFKRALDILNQESDLDQFRMAFVHNNIGEVYQKKGDTKQALKSFQQALEIFNEKPDDRKENVAWCFNNIGIVYLMEKNYSEALNYLQKAFNLKKELLPEKHPCLGNTYINLGNVYCDLGDYDLALNYYQESYEIFQTSLTQKHPSIARALKNIGVIHELKGDAMKASIYYNQALDLRQQILLPTHPDLLEIKQDIQRVLSKK